MATLILTKVWINRLDSGLAVSGQTTPNRDQAYDQAGEVRTYANGRQRAVTQAGERGTFAFRLEDVTAATLTTLRSWIGRDVQVRDHRGQVFFGVYFGVIVAERKEPTLYTAQITLKTITAPQGA